MGGGSEELKEWALPKTRKVLQAPHSRWELTLSQPPRGSHQHPPWCRTLTTSKQLFNVPKGCGQAKHIHGFLPSPLSKWPCFQPSPTPMMRKDGIKTPDLLPHEQNSLGLAPCGLSPSPPGDIGKLSVCFKPSYPWEWGLYREPKSSSRAVVKSFCLPRVWFLQSAPWPHYSLHHSPFSTPISIYGAQVPGNLRLSSCSCNPAPFSRSQPLLTSVHTGCLPFLFVFLLGINLHFVSIQKYLKIVLKNTWD